MTIYDFSAKNIQGLDTSLNEFNNKVVLIVNTASKCGLTPQYAELEKLYQTFLEKGLVVLGFPCNQFGEQEPGTNEEVFEFCQINYGVTFPIFEKVEVNGENRHPLFAYLTEQLPFEGFDLNNPLGARLHEMLSASNKLNNNDIKWNFTKFLIDREGNAVQRFEPIVTPDAMYSAIEAIL